MMNRILAAVRRLLHIDRIEQRQEQLQRGFDDARDAVERAIAKLDEISRTSDDPLAKFVHDARNSTFRRQIKREDGEAS